MGYLDEKGLKRALENEKRHMKAREDSIITFINQVQAEAYEAKQLADQAQPRWNTEESTIELVDVLHSYTKSQIWAYVIKPYTYRHLDSKARHVYLWLDGGYRTVPDENAEYCVCVEGGKEYNIVWPSDILGDMKDGHAYDVYIAQGKIQHINEHLIRLSECTIEADVTEALLGIRLPLCLPSSTPRIYVNDELYEVFEEGSISFDTPGPKVIRIIDGALNLLYSSLSLVIRSIDLSHYRDTFLRIENLSEGTVIRWPTQNWESCESLEIRAAVTVDTRFLSLSVIKSVSFQGDIIFSEPIYAPLPDRTGISEMSMTNTNTDSVTLNQLFHAYTDLDWCIKDFSFCHNLETLGGITWPVKLNNSVPLPPKLSAMAIENSKNYTLIVQDSESGLRELVWNAESPERLIDPFVSLKLDILVFSNGIPASASAFNGIDHSHPLKVYYRAGVFNEEDLQTLQSFMPEAWQLLPYGDPEEIPFQYLPIY